MGWRLCNLSYAIHQRRLKEIEFEVTSDEDRPNETRPLEMPYIKPLVAASTTLRVG
jgi:hypothetical protein